MSTESTHSRAVSMMNAHFDSVLRNMSDGDRTNAHKHAQQVVRWDRMARLVAWRSLTETSRELQRVRVARFLTEGSGG